MARAKILDKKLISGIQQIGVGVTNFYEAWRWYIPNFGMDVRIFEEKATAEYMLRYTDGKPRERHACLAMNMQGGGGFEIWQHTSRKAVAPDFELQLGDLGIFAGKIKSSDVKSAFERLSRDAEVITGLNRDPFGRETFYLKDPFNNIWQVVEEGTVFMNESGKHNGGTFGAVIGTTNPEKAIKLYSGVLGYDTIIYDTEGKFSDLEGVPGGGNRFRRVLLHHSEKRKGPFSNLFGPTEIELVQVLDRTPEKIFKNRIWGDLGFIHLCFDVLGMRALKKECAREGFPFTVDSDDHPSGKPFDMGEAAGHFAYVEDPDGTLIEFVETHRMPILKKLGWYINLWKRKDVTKPLPDWMMKMIRFMRVKTHQLHA